MKFKFGSAMFLEAKPGTPGRRLTRRLDDEAVERALLKSRNIEHQMKFMSPFKRAATVIRRSVTR